MEKFNIVIGTHGRFGEELVNSARMIAGALENVQCCSLLPEYSFEDYMKLADETMCTKEGFTIVLGSVWRNSMQCIYRHEQKVSLPRAYRTEPSNADRSVSETFQYG